jgi:predicted AlkP superfamily phosphohydrolase/phosphomutase
MGFLIRITVLTFFLCCGAGNTAHAYIGPGAGFAFISSFFILFLTGFLAFLTIITWPVRAAFIYMKRRKVRGRSKVQRVVVLGLDGMDPLLARQFMDEGRLPNFLNLQNRGSFCPLETTTPAMSPVAWSTFSTGVNPGKHRIFDFFTRDPKNYMPMLSSAHISASKAVRKIGPFKIPSKHTNVDFLRKSISFWKILGQNGVFSSVLRVPITFPPEKFYGAGLSAMCTPDLLGTQGTFALYTTESPDSLGQATGGVKIPIHLKAGRFETLIYGPPSGKDGTQDQLTIPVEGMVNEAEKTVSLTIGEHTVALVENQYSPWISLVFKRGFRKQIRGIARFLITEMEPHLKIYMTPINISPEKPAMAISHPFFYSVILSKLKGPFATLGLAEDTWALNERVIDESAFLTQAYDIFKERKAQFFDALKKNKDGLVVAVFDTTDRVQHMFFRYLTPDHPANRDKDTTKHKDVIQKLYEDMDTLAGETLQKLNDDDLFMVISDHGFKSFKWGVNLNSWLWKEGYLVLKEGESPGVQWYGNVDWTKTRAFAFGLVGIFLNIKGRERHGIVHSGEKRVALQQEIKEKLEALRDEENALKPIRSAYLSQDVLKGPYTHDAPDIFIGYEEGYRVSWNSAVGRTTDQVIEENTRSWSGDHCIDPALVPGVFFSNWKLEEKAPSIGDLGPTILNLFGLEPMRFHDGRVLTLLNPN